MQNTETTTPKGPIVQPGDVDVIRAILTGRGWCSAGQVAAIAYRDRRLTWNDRHIRAVASASNGQVISGQKGYKLTVEATAEEINHAKNWLRHQASEMTRRADEIEKVALEVV